MKPAWRLLLAVLACALGEAAAAPQASGKYWQLGLGGLACEGSVVTMRAQITYLGPSGAVESPVTRLVDGEGRAHAPRSLAWQGGSKLLAGWLSRGGLANVKTNEQAQLQFRFQLESAAGLKLEFGDIPAFAVAKAGKPVCESLLKPAQVRVPRKPAAGAGKATLRFYREAFPCAPARGPWRNVEAAHPPTLPEKLLVFGRGYLPGMREVDLPMGKAPAQGYAYAGPEEIAAIEAAARRALAADHPALAASARHYAFNWGLQRAGSNELYSIGVYAVGPCPN